MPNAETPTEQANQMRRAAGDLSGRARAEALEEALKVKNSTTAK